MRIVPAVLASLLAASAVAQIPIPAFANVYNGFSRGFNFTAQTNFFIVQLDLPLDAFVAGDTASYLVRVNGATVLYSTGNTAPVATSLPILTGDVVDIIGNWSPAVTGNFTAHNSYGSITAGAGAAPFASVIEGVPHTLNRVGWQWDITDPAYLSGAYLAPTTGQIGRVLVTTSTASGGTLATNTTLGQGCIREYASFYEQGSSSAFDLSNTTITWINNGGTYTVLDGIAGTIVPPTAAATVVAGGALDGEQAFTLSSAMPVLGGSTTTLNVCTKGYIAAAVGNGIDYTPTGAELIDFPQTTWACWHDFDQSPTGSGDITYEEAGGIAYVTVDQVYSYLTTAPNTLQWQFELASGNVTLVIGTMAGAASPDQIVVGFSPGGPNLDPGSTDLSAAFAMGAITTAAGDITPLTLTASSRPILGTNWNLTVGNIPATAIFGLSIYGGTDPGIPDLLFLGMPTCQLRADLGVVVGPWFPTGANYNYSAPIPAAPPALIGFELFAQDAVFQVPPVNAFGAITSNGIKGTLGDL